MARKALALPPTYGIVLDKQDAYLPSTQLRALAKQHGRYWSFHDVPTTVALPNNRFAKSLNPFTDHITEDAFRGILEEYDKLGCPRPSGYADVFHQRFISPRVPWSVNSLFAPCLAGGWQAALSPGAHKGIFYKYDLRSAYLWAATLGLPDTRTYTRSIQPSAQYDGLYRVKLREPSLSAPFPYNQARECIATNHEIDAYGLRVSEVVDGVVWKRMLSGEKVVEAVCAVSTWKQTGRAYWGRWGQMVKVECTANGKHWHLPNVALNVPWAHLIISRVKMRLWEASSKALHVFVDSVITSEKLQTGENVGDWRLEDLYLNGVIVRAPGQYGDLSLLKLDRMSGVSKDSPLRNNPVAA